MYKKYLFIFTLIFVHADDSNLSTIDNNITITTEFKECNLTTDHNSSFDDNGSFNEENITLEIPSKNFNMCKGDSKKGEEIFKKFLKKPCQTTAYKFATHHSQDEWEEIAESGRFRETLFSLCQNLREIYQDDWSPHLYQFSYEHANDS